MSFLPLVPALTPHRCALFTLLFWLTYYRTAIGSRAILKHSPASLQLLGGGRSLFERPHLFWFWSGTLFGGSRQVGVGAQWGTGVSDGRSNFSISKTLVTEYSSVVHQQLFLKAHRTNWKEKVFLLNDKQMSQNMIVCTVNSSGTSCSWVMFYIFVV
jgi:hypothetical protein